MKLKKDIAPEGKAQTTGSKAKKWLIISLKAIGIFVVAMLCFVVAVNFNLFNLFGKSPSMDSIMNPHNNIASEIYSSDDQLIGKFYNENRTPVKFSEINPVFWQALVSTEDERFYEHHGIDFYGFGAAFKDMVIHGHPRGASTITQQLAKNMYRVRTYYSTGLLGNIPGLRMLIIKCKEWILAVKLEMFYSKNEILNMYANTVEFGSNTYGINTASKVYFNKRPSDLKAEEAAVLVGILKATTFYNPLLNPENSRNRRNVVLSNMQKAGHLTQVERDSLAALPLQLNYHPDETKDGLAGYFREAVASELKEWCDLSGFDVYSDGLKIYTTLDSRMQKFAENAVLKNMRRIQSDFFTYLGGSDPWKSEQPQLIDNIAEKTAYYKELVNLFGGDKDSVDDYMNKPHETRVFSYDGPVVKEMSTMDSIRYMCKYLHCGFVAMDPNNGYVRAWVGDVDYASWQYDKVTSTRQPGSTFKLFVYTEAMNQGMTPLDTCLDGPITVLTDKYQNWMPTNANGRFSNTYMTLRDAFATSVNSIAVRLGQKVGVSAIARTAYDMGITTELNETPAMCLGASDVKLIDLADSYCCIANGGTRVTPIIVTKITDSQGKVVYQCPVEKQQVLPKRTAALMQQMLMGGVQQEHGTSHSLLGYIGDVTDTDFGGKTGTTNNYSDGWFMGVTPNLVCGAWVGGEYRSIHFHNGQGQGAKTALPICAEFLSKVYHSSSFRSLHRHFEEANSEEYYINPCDSDSLQIVDSLLYEDNYSNDSI